MDWKELGIEVNLEGPIQQKVKCPNCKKIGKEHYNDPCLSINLVEQIFYCHKCGWKGSLNTHRKYEKPSDEQKGAKISEDWINYFQKRKISLETLESIGITEGKLFMPERGKEVKVIQFNYYRNGEIINIKYRDSVKNFRMFKNAELIFYNIDSMIDNDSVIITEGEIDTLTFLEVGFKSVISVPNGAVDGRSNLDYIKNCENYFKNIKKIYIATDNDTPGIKLGDELIRRFGKNKCYKVFYPDDCKDANEVLVKKGADEVLKLIEEARLLPLEDVYTVESVRNIMIYEFEHGKAKGTTTYFNSLDPHFTWKPGDLSLFFGIFNHGKSAFVNELMLLKSVREGAKWGIFSPEHYPANEFFDNLIMTYLGKSVDPKYKNCCSKQEYLEALDFINEHFFYIFPAKEAPTQKYINDKFEELIVREGICGGVIDPFNQLYNPIAEAGGISTYLDRFLAEEKMFALRHDFYKVIVAHPRTLQKNSKGNYDIPTAYELYGGSLWGDKCDNLICYHRPKYWTDKSDPSCIIDIQKIKKQALVGIPGQVELQYNRKTFRLEERTVLGWKSPFDGRIAPPDPYNKDEEVNF